jgi:hypothetical protein
MLLTSKQRKGTAMSIDTRIISLPNCVLLSPEKAREAVRSKYFLDPDANFGLQRIINGDDPAQHYLLEFEPQVLPAVFFGELKLADLTDDGLVFVTHNGMTYHCGEYFDLTPMRTKNRFYRVLIRLPLTN